MQSMYQKYQIMPSLQMHMMRVAGVAQMITRALAMPVGQENIVLACLLHDMGNIIKFKLDLFPQFVEPEGLDFWQNVRDDFVARYGDDEHTATMMISTEILESGLFFKHNPSLRSVIASQRVFELIDAIGFSKAKQNYESADIGKKICAYADMRVMPIGVTSLTKRLEDGNKRFRINKTNEKARSSFFKTMASYLRKLEKQIFAGTSLRPQDITDANIEQYIKAFV
ncbi:hypothetical protein KC726_04310 [Candidatus Woesebacteria bacterium]|nr:hypothetical protein [Candidatus Woesebacteria bacterium]